MARNSLFAFILGLLLIGAEAQAGNSVPQFLPFQGRATDTSGQPINVAATFKFRIYPPAGACYLYEDTQVITPNGYGFFSVIIGTLGNRTGPANSLETVFSNEAAMPDSCAGTYTPSANDWRRLEVVVDGTALPTMQTIAASAFSMNAHMLDGKTSSGYLQVIGSATQANIATLVNGSDASALHNHNSQYAGLTGNNTFSGNLTTTGSFYGSAAGSTIGIGTTTAAADIDIRKTAPSILLSATASGGGNATITFSSGNTQRAQIRASETTNELRFYTGSTQAMVLDQNQNLTLTGSLLVGGVVNLGQYTTAQETTLVSGLGVGNAGAMWVNTTTNQFKFWNGSTAIAIGSGSFVTSVTAGSGLTNSGTAIAPNLSVLYGTSAGTALEGNQAAGGDISGTFSSLTVANLRGNPLSAISPASGQVLTWNGSAWWPANIADGSLSSNVPLKNAANTFTAANLFQGATATTTPLTVQTTDNDLTNFLFSVKNQAGTPIATIRADAVPTNATDLTTKSYVDTQNTADRSYADSHLGSRTVSTNAPNSGDVLAWNGSSWMPGVVNAVQLQGRTVSATAPSSQYVLKWNGSQWEPAPDSDQGGDITEVTAGTGLSGGGLFGPVTLSLATTSVTAASYGSSSSVASFTVDAYGRLTLAQTQAIAIPTTQLTQTSAASGQVLKWNGSAWLPAADTDTGITALTGDITATGTGSVAATIGNDKVTSAKLNSTGIAINRVLITNASDGSTINYASCSVDGQVLKFAAATGWYCADDSGAAGIVTSISTGTGLSGGPITSAGTISLANTAVTAGSYGSTSSVATFTVDAQGRLTLAQTQAIAIATTQLTQTSAASGQVLKWNGSAWLAAADSDSGGDITGVTVGTGLSGGGTGGAPTISLANTAVTAGSFGSATQVATFTVDAQGRLTNAGLATIAIEPTQINQYSAASGQVLKWNGSAWLPANDTDTDSGGDIQGVTVGTGLSGGGTGGSPTISLANTAVTAGSFGSATQVATFTVDAQGRLTNAGATTIAIPTTQLTQTSAASGQVLKWNGSAWLPAADTDTGITSLTGDITASGSGSVNATLGNDKVTSAKINSTGIAINRLLVTNASDGTTINYASCSVDGQVLKFAAATGWYCANDSGAAGIVTQIDTGTGLTGGPITSAGTVSLANTAVTASSYGSTSAVATFTVDAQGRLTLAQTQPIAIQTTQLTQTSAASGQVLKWNGSAWLAADDTDSGGDIQGVTVGTGLSGGGTGGSPTVSLANTAVTAGSFGSATQIATFTVDAQGRLTNAGSTTIAIEPTQINQFSAASGQVLKWNGSAWLPANDTDTDSGGDIQGVTVGTGLSGGGTGGSPTISLANTAVTAASYGSASSVATFTVDAQGRLTLAQTQAIAINPTQINQYSAASGQVLKWNGSAWLPASDTDTGITALTGDITASGSGSVAATIGNDKVTSAKINSTGIAINRLLVTNASDGTTINYASCSVDGQVLKYAAASGWYCANDSGAAGIVTQIDTGTGLTGGPITSAGTVSLANTSVTAGSYGSTSSVATFTVDAQGRLTLAQTQPIAIQTTQLTQTSAASGQVLKWNGSAWLAADDTDSGGDIQGVTVGTGLSGGGTGGSPTISLANTAVTAGSFGSATQVATFTVDAQGRLTNAGATTIAIEPTQINQYSAASGQVLKWNGSAWLPANDTDTDSGGDIQGVTVGTGLSGGGTGGSPTISLANTAVTAASYGSASSVATFTVDAQGRLTLAQSQPISISSSQISQSSAASGQVLKWNGSAWLAADDSGGITALTGDITASGSGSVAATIGNDKVTSAKINSTGIAINRLLITNASDGSTINYASCSVDGQVLKYAAASGWYCANDSGAAGIVTQIDTGTGLTGGPITTSGTVSLANTSVTAGSYGSTSSVATFTVDAQGRLTLAQTQAIAISSSQITQSSAASGQVLKWSGSAWLPADDTDTDSGGDIQGVTVGTGLSGGGTGGSPTISLANTAVTAGSFGSATQVATFTVDAQGRLTNAGATPIAIEPTQINQYSAASGQVLKWNGSAWLPANDTDTDSGGDITGVTVGTGLSGGGTGGAPTISLANTAVTASSYGSSSEVATFTVDAQGRLTLAQTQAIAIPTTQLTQTSAASGQVLKWNGSAWLPADDAGGIAGVTAGTGLSGGGSSGTPTVTLANTAVTAASYGSSSSVATFTVDAQGRLTLAQTQSIAINPTQINQYSAASGQVLKWNGSAWLAADDSGGIGDITDVVAGTGLAGGATGNAATLSLATTAVTAASYGSTSSVATFTVDAYGRLTLAQTQPISIVSTQISQSSAASGQVLKWNGSAWLAADDSGGITALTGDITASGTGSVAATIGNDKVTSSKLASTGIAINRLIMTNASDGTTLGYATCNVDGQVLKYTAASGWGCSADTGGSITSIVAGTGLAGGGATDAVTLSLATTAVTASSYGSASSVASFTVDAYGRLTLAQSQTIAIPTTQLTQTSAATDQYLKWNGSAWLPGEVTSLALVTSITSPSNLSVTSASGSTLTLGNSGASSVIDLNSPTVNVGGAATTTVNIGSTPLTTLALGSAATGALTTTLGSTAGASSTAIRSGTAGTVIASLGTTSTAINIIASGAGGGVTISPSSTGTILVGGASSGVATFGNNSGAAATTLRSGTGGITLTSAATGNAAVTIAATGTNGGITLTPVAAGNVYVSTGNVGIGSATPATKLDVAGSASVTGSVTAAAFFYSSDRRLKSDFRKISGLESILRLNGVRFKWRTDASDDIGLVAQEVEEVFPELVTVNPATGFKAVKYGNLVAPLIESTKELYGMCRANESQLRSIAAAIDYNAKATDDRLNRLEIMLNQVIEENRALRREIQSLRK